VSVVVCIIVVCLVIRTSSQV